MIRRPPRSTPLYSSAASDVYKRQMFTVLLHLPPSLSRRSLILFLSSCSILSLSTNSQISFAFSPTLHASCVLLWEKFWRECMAYHLPLMAGKHAESPALRMISRRYRALYVFFHSSFFSRSRPHMCPSITKRSS
eukprot:TRINITY_DN2519_c0_g2_i1.p1 TRINITY_DN2519_c0_g2~~TRINITY_DN2519_c0_g2_i1.p1  ORF type:complete len:145 (-),score=11.22 TRINITY_DN2519_c0_g2_i1:302-706(-)